jgi:hypothetical protein
MSCESPLGGSLSFRERKSGYRKQQLISKPIRRGARTMENRFLEKEAHQELQPDLHWTNTPRGSIAHRVPRGTHHWLWTSDLVAPSGQMYSRLSQGTVEFFESSFGNSRTFVRFRTQTVLIRFVGESPVAARVSSMVLMEEDAGQRRGDLTRMFTN